MEPVNAFIAHPGQPTAAEVEAALGPAWAVWKQLLEWLAAEHELTESEWNSASPKYGWALRVKRKKRNIIYLGPCKDCFRASLVLGPKAVAAAHQAGLSKALLKTLDEAPRYPEGLGLRLLVKRPADLAAVRAIVPIKLAN